MQKQTYLQQSLRNDRLIRWDNSCMPLKFYIAPFNFYSKAGEDYKYREMVQRALLEWQKISNGMVTFSIEPVLLNSQINLTWKRVERVALGNCLFNYDMHNRLYSAEVQIGISDGLIHKAYMPEGEVYHTILHEIGHALGLGHSPFEEDIMYSPHKFGNVNISKHDKLTLQWLYRFPQNATIQDIATKYGFHTNDIDDIITQLIAKNPQSEFEKVKSSLKVQHRDLLEEQQNIADLKKYNIALQNITLSPEIRNTFIRRQEKK